MGILCIKNNTITQIEPEIPIKMPIYTGDNDVTVQMPIQVNISCKEKLIMEHCDYVYRTILKYEPPKIRQRRIFETIIIKYKEYIYSDKTHILDELDKEDIIRLFNFNKLIQIDDKIIEESKIYLKTGIWPYFDERKASENHKASIKKSNDRAKKDKEERDKRIQQKQQLDKTYKSGFSEGIAYYKSTHRNRSISY